MLSKLLKSLCAFSIVANSYAQVKQVIFAEGGSFGAPNNKVTFSAFNPSTNQITTFDSIPGDFTSGIAINGHIGFLYVGNSVDSLNFLCKYDLKSKKLLEKVSMPGVQSIQLYKDLLLVTKGYPLSQNFFAIYKQKDLSLVKDFMAVNQACKGMAIWKNKAFIAVEGSWPNYTDSGTVQVIDLTSFTYEKTLKLDTLNKVIKQIGSYNDKLYFIGDSLITAYDPIFATYTHKGLGNKIQVLNINKRNIILKLRTNEVNRYLIDSIGNTPALLFDQPSIAGVYDQFSNVYYAINTDYFSFGHLVRSAKGGSKDTFKIRIAAEAIALYEKATENFDDQFTINAGVVSTLNILANDFILGTNAYSIQLTKNSSIPGSSALIKNNQLEYTASYNAGIDTLYYNLCDSVTGFCTNASITINILKSSSIDLQEKSKVTVYLNEYGYLNIEGIEQNSSIKIYNALGHVYTAVRAEESIVWNLNSLPKGMYFVQVDQKIYKIVL
jgi:hypothetical protein